jgi:hypothetical protein
LAQLFGCFHGLKDILWEGSWEYEEHAESGKCQKPSLSFLYQSFIPS